MQNWEWDTAANCGNNLQAGLGWLGAAGFIRRPVLPAIPWALHRNRRFSTQSADSDPSAGGDGDAAKTPLLGGAAVATAVISPEGRRQQLAITLCWFAMGFVNALPGVALRQFMIEELRADPATQAIIYGVIGPMVRVASPSLHRPSIHPHTRACTSTPHTCARTHTHSNLLLTLDPRRRTAQPWNFKFVAAFISDSCPVFGHRRVP